MIITGYIQSQYYRGYSLRQRSDQAWEIWWGERISLANTLPEAEAVVDSWLDAR